MEENFWEEEDYKDWLIIISFVCVSFKCGFNCAFIAPNIKGWTNKKKNDEMMNFYTFNIFLIAVCWECISNEKQKISFSICYAYYCGLTPLKINFTYVATNGIINISSTHLVQSWWLDHDMYLMILTDYNVDKI